MILAAVAVLVLALSVPAIGSGTDWFGLAKQANKKAKHASKRSKQAKKTSKKAKKKARQANQTAKNADESASQANQKAEQLQGELNSTAVKSAKAAGTVSTDSQAYVSLTGGPSVTVDVPPSGLIEVWAQANILDNDDGGAVALFEDGQPVPGQATECDPDISRALFLWVGTNSGEQITVGTPSVLSPAFGCGTEGPAAPVLFERPPGQHTYELRYADPCPCNTSEFSNRVLRVGPRL